MVADGQKFKVAMLDAPGTLDASVTKLLVIAGTAPPTSVGLLVPANRFAVSVTDAPVVRLMKEPPEYVDTSVLCSSVSEL